MRQQSTELNLDRIIYTSIIEITHPLIWPHFHCIGGGLIRGDYSTKFPPSKEATLL
jgi:hypothetical protein